MRGDKFDSENQVQAIVAAIQCKNRMELQRLLEYDRSVLYWKEKSEDGNTLRHILTKLFGWNEEVAWILRLTLQESTTTDKLGSGIFERNNAGVTPFLLSLIHGAEFEEIFWYLQHNEEKHLEENLVYIPRLIAEFCTDMTILEYLLSKDQKRVDSLLDEGLYFACEFQNEAMIRYLFAFCVRVHEDDSDSLQRRLSATRNVPSDSATASQTSALGALILGLGNMDPDVALSCAQACREFIPQLDFVGGAMEEEVWTTLMLENRCIKTLHRIKLHFGVSSNKVLSLSPALIQLVAKWQEWPETTSVVDFLVESVSRLEGEKVLLDACSNGLQWNYGLKQLVMAFPKGLDVPSPDSHLLPYQSAATDQAGMAKLIAYSGKPTSRLAMKHRSQRATFVIGTIYELLRANPGVLRGSVV